MFDRKNWQQKPWGYLGIGKMKNLEISGYGREWMLGSWTGKGTGRKHQHGIGTLKEMFDLADKMRQRKPKKDWDGKIDGIDLGFRRASLRDKVIRLAKENPELRQHLLPLLKESNQTIDVRKYSKTLEGKILRVIYSETGLDTEHPQFDQVVSQALKNISRQF